MAVTVSFPVTVSVTVSNGVCDDVGTWPEGGPQQSCRRVIHFVCLCVVCVSFFLFI